PLLLAALATGYAPLQNRRKALEMIERGCRLPKVAAAVGLPIGFRTVPPEQCRETLAAVRWSADAACSLGNEIPSGGMDGIGGWVDAVSFAARAADQRFAVWIGKYRVLVCDGTFETHALLPVAMYAWASGRPDDLLHRCVSTPWSERLSFVRALLETKIFTNRVTLSAYFEDEPIADPWVERDRVDGFDFVPLTHFSQIKEESDAMNICVDAYADKLARNACRLISVWQGSARVATLEIEADRGGAGARRIQLKGPDNSNPQLPVLLAADAWLAGQPQRDLRGPPSLDAGRRAAKFRTRIASYWEAVGVEMADRCGARTLTPAWVDEQLYDLARRTRVSEWPFRTP
ncbi:MAG: hypothetical protein ACREC6_12430, partial [Hyphomicrobiaceae bacterium]